MTYSRKIQILETVINKFEEIIPLLVDDVVDKWVALDKLNANRGICNYAVYEVMTLKEQIEVIESGYHLLTDYFQKEFKIKMPASHGLYNFPLTKSGYKARVKACKNAIVWLKIFRIFDFHAHYKYFTKNNSPKN